MKKLLSLLAIVTVTTFFYSCETESLDSDLLQQEIDNPTNPTNPTNPGASGSYWPYAINNEWEYENASDNQTMKIISTETYQGNSYFKVDNLFGAGNNVAGSFVFLLRYDNGKYRLNTRGTLITPPGAIAPYEYSVLRDDLPAGGTWTETAEQVTTYTGIPTAITMTNTYQGTILEKGVSVTVAGETYPDVIHSKMVSTSTMTGFPMPPTVVTTEYWFAKNVGPVKAVITTGGTTNTTVLVDYLIN